jgi:septum formation protein
MRLILASASPRRAELLRAAGYEFEVVAATIDESIRPNESPPMYVRRLAADKSAWAQAGTTKAAPHVQAGTAEAAPHGRELFVGPRFSGAERIVLGADTAVVVDGEILGKPRDDEDAARMLRRLSGMRHEVLTGVSLRQGASEVGRVETTAVSFRALLEEDIAWYVASGEGRDKAGAYAIQGLASRFIPRIEGSYSNVVGLPVACVAELMRLLLASGP